MNIIQTDRELVCQVLHATNLIIESALLQEIIMVVKSVLPNFQTGHGIQITILSISAITAQCKRIPGVLQGTMVPVGLPMQMFLRHVSAENKHPLLDCIELMLLKWQPTQVDLVNKVRKLKQCYQTYQSYCFLFQKLACFTGQIAQLQLRIFWVVYLTLKNKYKPNFILQDKIILGSLLKCAFQRMIGDIDSDTVNIEIKNYLKIDSPLQKSIIEQCQTKINQILRSTYQFRYSESHNINFICLSCDQFFLARFLDDFSNIYQQWQQRNQETIINEILFLNLQKTLTPLAIRKAVINLEAICEKIDFSDEQDDENESSSDGSSRSSTDRNDDQNKVCLRSFQPFQSAQINPQNSPAGPRQLQLKLKSYCKNWKNFQKKLTKKHFLKSIRIFLQPKIIKSKAIRKINKQIRSLRSPKQFFQFILPCLRRYHGYDRTALATLELKLQPTWN